MLYISPIYSLPKEKLQSMTIYYIYFLFLLLGIQEGDKQLIRETSTHQLNSERYVHTFKDLSNFSGAINVTYRYLAATPLQRKRKYPYTFNFFLMFIYFWRKKRQRVSGGGAEKEGDTESEAGFRLWVVSAEPKAGLEPTNQEIMTWAEIGGLADWAT